MWQCPKCQRQFSRVGQSHYCGEPETDIDEYIAAQPTDVQPILTKLRETIRAVAPDASERMSWRMPTFWQGQIIIQFAAFKKHISIFPGDLERLPFQQRLQGYRTTKGGIQLPLDQPIDYELVADITRCRLAQTQTEQ